MDDLEDTSSDQNFYKVTFGGLQETTVFLSNFANDAIGKLSNRVITDVVAIMSFVSLVLAFLIQVLQDVLAYNVPIPNVSGMHVRSSSYAQKEYGVDDYRVGVRKHFRKR